jgi:hypothetical protein
MPWGWVKERVAGVGRQEGILAALAFAAEMLRNESYTMLDKAAA